MLSQFTIDEMDVLIKHYTHLAHHGNTPAARQAALVKLNNWKGVQAAAKYPSLHKERNGLCLAS